MKFTVDSIAALKLRPGETDRFEWDDKVAGWGIRLRKRRAYWIFQYTTGARTESGRKQQRRLKFGSYPAMGVPEAREKAAAFDAEVLLGGDPQGAKAENQAKAGETFEACVKLYLARRRNDPKLRESSYREIERHLSRNLEKLGPTRIDHVNRRAIALELANVAHTSGPIQANRTRTSLVKFMNWCAGEGLIAANPATFTNKNPEVSRDRVLTITELARVWHGGGEGDYADIVRLLMLLGQREREIGDLRWSEIDLDRAVITLPPQRTKNRRWHSVPLSAPAVEILRARPQNGRALVFGRGQGDRGFSGWSRAKARLDAAIQIEPWVVHDLRRTLDTVMNDQLGIAPHVVEAILNHVSSHKSGKAGVAGVYNHATYLKEKNAALRIWADHIMAAVEGRENNVVPLQRAAE